MKMKMKIQIPDRVKFIISIPSIIISLLFGMAAHAACITNSGGAIPRIVNFTQPQITVQRDAPVGSVIGTLNTPNGGGLAFNSCDNGNVYYAMSLFTTPSTIAHVYKTNLDGVGVSVSQGSSFYYDAPATARYINIAIAVVTDARTVNFIKTGPITSGVISSGLLARNYGDDGITAYSLNFTGSSVTQVACSINTPNIQVPLDDVLGGSLTAVGTVAKPKVFNLGLNCDAGTRINMTMSGIQNADTSTAGVLQLTNAGATDVASGVGIQILYNGTAVPVNGATPMVLKTSTGGVETFPFTAQYYQTKAASQVKTGSANATATLNLTYQ